ncbi:MAG: MBL fold metallo-hydrolase [Bacteroidales bacterium]
MKIITLIENNSVDEDLKSEHGLSIYIETENHKILFDTGQSDLFLINARKFNIDLKEVDKVVISHGHYDHLGGLIHFLQFNQKAKIYLKKEIFDFQYFSIRSGKKKHIGYSKDLLEYKDRFVFVENQLHVLDNLYFIADIDKKFPLPKGNKILFKEKDNQLLQDDFKHELIFVINSLNGLYIFCGCAHNGILNTISTVQRFFPDFTIHKVFGGFHLIEQNEFVETETDNEILSIASELKQLTAGATFFTGHCTGNHGFNLMSNILEQKIQKLTISSEIITL